MLAKDLKAAARKPYTHLMLTFTGITTEVEFEEVLGDVRNTRTLSGDAGGFDGCGRWSLLYAQSDMSFFFDSLRATDKVTFHVRDCNNSVLAKQGRTNQELMATVKRYKKDGVTLSKIYEVKLDDKIYSVNERTIAPINQRFIESCKNYL